ncbi:hypothetical protein GCM10027348_06380 [Hymenobacter tenuis]
MESVGEACSGGSVSEGKTAGSANSRSGFRPPPFVERRGVRVQAEERRPRMRNRLKTRMITSRNVTVFRYAALGVPSKQKMVVKESVVPVVNE